MKSGIINNIARPLESSSDIDKNNQQQYDISNSIKYIISKFNTFQTVHLVKLIRCLASIAVNNKPGWFNNSPKIEITNERLIAFIQKVSPFFTNDEAKFLADQFTPTVTQSGAVEYSESLKALFKPLQASKLSDIGSLSMDNVHSYLEYVGIITRSAPLISGVFDNNTITLPRIKIDDLENTYNYYRLYDITDLRYTDFRGVNVGGIWDLGGLAASVFQPNTFFKNKSACYSDMSRAEFSDISMDGIDLSGAELSHICLNRVSMKSSNFSGANMPYATIDDVNMSRSNLAGVNMTNLTVKNFSDMRRANLTNADLSNSKIKDLALYNANLTNTNMSNSKIKDLYISDATMTNTDLSNTVIEGIHFLGTNLSSVNLSGTKITLTLNGGLNENFNHLHNYTRGSIITAICSINDKYKDLKINLMLQVIYYLRSQNISLIIPALIDIFDKNPIYLDHEHVQIFISNSIICTLQIQTAKLNPLPDNIIKCFMAAVKSLNDDSQLPNPLHYYMREYNSFFVQLYYWSQKSSAEEVKSIGRELWAKYLTIPGVAPIKEHYDNIMMQWEDDDTLIFINKREALVVQSLYLDKNLHGNKSRETTNGHSVWDNCSYYNNREFKHVNHRLPESRPALHKIFESFPLFQKPYENVRRGVIFDKLIGLLNLGDLTQHFIDATFVKSYPIQIVSVQYSDKLADIFQAFVVGGLNKISLTHDDALDMSLAPVHVNDILFVYEIEDDKEQQARLFLCLSAVFARYSSSYVFGVGVESPVQLRNYALALLNKAIELVPSLVEHTTAMDWKTRFTGVDRDIRRSCSAGISDNMVLVCKQIAPGILNKIMPPAWS